jgi:hypothetical protein
MSLSKLKKQCERLNMICDPMTFQVVETSTSGAFWFTVTDGDGQALFSNTLSAIAIESELKILQPVAEYARSFALAFGEEAADVAP